MIAQTKLAKYTVVTGTYVDHSAINEDNYGKELQAVLKTELTDEKPCEVCAMGACFISTIRLYDDFKLSSTNISWGDLDSRKMKNKVAKIFSRREMGVLESCFELEGVWLKTKSDKSAFGQAGYGDMQDRVFRTFLTDLGDDDRLIFLMEVVLENPKQQVTVQVVKDTLLRFFIEGRYTKQREALGL